MTSETEVKEQEEGQQVDVTPTKDGGVLKLVKREGEGEERPGEGDTVFVHYVGTLTNGTVFDSSRDRGTPFEFQLGRGNVIKAWDMGVATMRRGELAVLTCGSEYAYGEVGSSPKIPPNATLVFEVELLDWKPEDLSPDKDGSIFRQQVVEGTGYSCPNEGASVKIRMEGPLGDSECKSQEFEFALGEGSEHSIPPGVEVALEKFKRGEKSVLTLTGKQGNGKYEVELLNFELARETWQMDSEEKTQQAKISKEKGTKFFQKERYALALKSYQKVVSLLDSEIKGGEGEGVSEQKTLVVAGHLNQALCYLKMGDWMLARDECTKALDIEPDNAKGLFRRGQAYLGFGEPRQAMEDFKAVQKLEPGNKAVPVQMQACCAKIKEQTDKEKKIYANMFDKFARIDQKKEDDARKNQPDVLSGTLGEWGDGNCEGEHTHGHEEEAFNTDGPTIIDTSKYYGCVSD